MDIIIHFSSNHPHDHKLAAFRYYINRMITLPITEQARKQEWRNIIIIIIAHNNGFPEPIIQIFEKLIYERLFDHFSKNTILSEHQYGFRSEMSTENASYMLLNDILTAMNSKQIVGGIFCDLQKAFDCINHEVLLKKLEFYGVTTKFYNLIKSYLEGRYQKVVINCTTVAESTWEKIKQGVPQGSILGPILFLIYINDLPKLAPTGTKILLYADDTSIIVTSPNLAHYENQINEIFKEVNYWFKLNQLKLNYNKTHYLQFT